MRTDQRSSAEGDRPTGPIVVGPVSRWRAGRAVKWVGVLAVLVSVAFGVPASAVSGGDVVPAGTHRFLARVVVGGQACSGALVSPQWVVTAARCLPASGVPAGATATLGDVNAATGAGRRITVVDVVRRTDRDLALLRLETAATGVSPVPLGTTAPAVGGSLLVAGFGRTATQWVPDRPHSVAFTVAGVGATTAALTGPGGADTCKGDAGGPALRAVGGGVELVAVHSTSWQHDCLDVDETRQGSTETRTDDIADWIRQHTSLSQARFGQVVGANGLCLDVDGGRDDSGTGFISFACHAPYSQSVGAQAFTATNDGLLRVMGKCLDANGPATAEGWQLARLWPCTGGTEQQWRFNADGTITNIRNGYCLDATTAVSESRVITHPCHGTPNQNWGAPTGQARFGQVVGVGGLCLDVDGGRDDSGTGFILFACHAPYSQSVGAQAFTVTNDGLLRVMGKCLDANGPAFDQNWQQVRLWPCIGSAEQKWSLNANGSVTSTRNGYCLDATTAVSESRVITHPCHGTPNQSWTHPTWRV